MADILKLDGITNYKLLPTPIHVSHSMIDTAKLYDDPTQYRSLVGALQYRTVTLPDLSYAVISSVRTCTLQLSLIGLN